MLYLKREDEFLMCPWLLVAAERVLNSRLMIILLLGWVEGIESLNLFEFWDLMILPSKLRDPPKFPPSK